jgi:hypothetical protein
VTGTKIVDRQEGQTKVTPYFWPYDFNELLRAAADLERLRDNVGAVNPRPPGWHNELIQLVKKVFARSLSWYTRPLREFNDPVSRSLEEIAGAIDHLSMNVVALEKRSALWERQATSSAHDRTTYIIGLFGTGRHYINDMIRRNIGERSKYFRDAIRLHPGPTPMIYSGHATMKHISRDQAAPDVMRLILDAVDSGFANVIFIYRHPLDSLLTNWVWWRTYVRDNKRIAGISEIYGATGDLCADLEKNFPEFQSFAEGDSAFFAAAPGQPFLSFREFVEETELHMQSATLTLRLEDFVADPRREFCKIAETMAVEIEPSSLSLERPKSKAYGYRAVREKVPRFRDFIDGLDADTRMRIEAIGYHVS